MKFIYAIWLVSLSVLAIAETPVDTEAIAIETEICIPESGWQVLSEEEEKPTLPEEK